MDSFKGAQTPPESPTKGQRWLITLTGSIIKTSLQGALRVVALPYYHRAGFLSFSAVGCCDHPLRVY